MGSFFVRATMEFAWGSVAGDWELFLKSHKIGYQYWIAAIPGCIDYFQ
jgi:hypothetical protein